ncbi:MAG TPA: HAD family hydrolase [Victivallales bacterium]|nr:HAD family hydrolase [Victivallales bacterium]
MKKNKACFLDRDGVLIEEVNYLSYPSQILIFENSYKALKLLRDNDYKIIVITNQAGVARGYFKETDITVIHKEIDRFLSLKKLSIDKYYYCPHHPEGTVPEYSFECACRKPAPGLIFQAVKDFDIDLGESFLIGDKMSDINSAKNAGCFSILVKTGHGLEHTENAQNNNIPIKENILDAVQFYLSK